MDTSTRMITSAAMSATRQLPMKLLPPTISAIGRAIRLKLITAPPIAITSTNRETKNCTSDDDDSMRSARSVCLMISSYSAMWRSTIWVRCSSLVTLPSTEQLDGLRVGDHGLEAQMALLGRGAELVAGAILGLDHRFIDRSCSSTSATIGSPGRPGLRQSP